jgi:Transglycosylase SLT domain
MRWLLISVALCGAVPALASEFPPELGSFAYPITHDDSASLFPFDYDTALPPPPAKPQPEPAAAAAPGAAPSRPLFSKTELCSTVAFEAAINKIPVRFFANLIEQESSFNPRVVSYKGAQGIAQFMPGTAAEQGLADPFEPIQALSASAKSVAYLLERFGNLGLAAAAYNAGPQRVLDWLSKQGSMPLETQNYVRRITGLPVEAWARPDSKGEEVSLPPHAECPQFRLASADPLVNTRMLLSDKAKLAGSGRRYDKYAKFRGSALKYVTLSPSVSHSAPNDFTKGAYASVRVRLASGTTSSK